MACVGAGALKSSIEKSRVCGRDSVGTVQVNVLCRHEE